jgi:hypothetical protein
MNYNELTWRYFSGDERVGSLAGPAVTRGSAGSRAQGTWVQFDLEWLGHAVEGDGAGLRAGDGAGGERVAVGSARRRVRDARFLAFGCPHTIAVAAWLVEQAVAALQEAGTGLPEALPLIARRFDVPTEKLGRLLLVEDAWLAATLLS